MFKPGQSGNPGGRPKAVAEVVALARHICPDAIAKLNEIMLDPDTPPVAAVQAARELLDRGCGKARKPF